MGTLEKLFSQMHERRSPSINILTTLPIAPRNLGFTSGYQAYRNEIDANVRISMKTDFPCDVTPSAAPIVRDSYPDRHCSWRQSLLRWIVIRRCGLRLRWF